MYSFAVAEAWSSDEMWAWFTAAAELRAAADALESAAAELSRLVEDTQWQSKGMRALNERLACFRERTALEIGHVSIRRSELDGIAAS